MAPLPRGELASTALAPALGAEAVLGFGQEAISASSVHTPTPRSGPVQELIEIIVGVPQGDGGPVASGALDLLTECVVGGPLALRLGPVVVVRTGALPHPPQFGQSPEEVRPLRDPAEAAVVQR